MKKRVLISIASILIVVAIVMVVGYFSFPHHAIVSKTQSPVNKVQNLNGANNNSIGRDTSDLGTVSAQDKKAIDMVRGIPDVQQWLGLFTGSDKISAGTPVFEITSKLQGVYMIYAYEQTSNEKISYNRYAVNVENGEITSQIQYKD